MTTRETSPQATPEAQRPHWEPGASRAAAPQASAEGRTQATPEAQRPHWEPGASRAAASQASAEVKTRYVPGTGDVHRHVLVVIVNNRPGVLNRVASLVRARNFNIESLAVGHTERPDVSRMTITLRGDDFAVEQMGKQLYRLIDVLKIQDLPASNVVEHELALIKVRATNHNRAELLKIVELYRGHVVDVGPDSVIIEHSGTEQEIESLIALLASFGIKELVRTGTVAMARGSGAIDLETILRAGAVPALPIDDEEEDR